MRMDTQSSLQWIGVVYAIVGGVNSPFVSRKSIFTVIAVKAGEPYWILRRKKGGDQNRITTLFLKCQEGVCKD